MGVLDSNLLGRLYDSMAYEVSILIVFFFSWLAWQFVSRNRRIQGKKVQTIHESGKKRQGASGRGNKGPDRLDLPGEAQLPAETPQALQKEAMQIIQLAQEQYTRALRMYRDLVRKGADSQIRDEAFYFSLVQASIRVGNADVVCELLTKAHKYKVALSMQFFQSVLKLLASKQLYQECLTLQGIFKSDLPVERTICSCITLAASECGHPEAGIQAVDRLRTAGEAVIGRDYQNIFRSYAKTANYASAQKLLDTLIEIKVPLEPVITNIVLATCIAAGRTDVAQELLTKAEQSGTPDMESSIPLDVVSYNTVMKGYVKDHKLTECFSLITAMKKRDIATDEVTYSTLLDACVAENDIEKASAVIDHFINSGCVMNTVLYTTFMKGFVRMHMLDKAMALYNQMRTARQQHEEGQPDPPKPDVILYSVLIKGNCDHRLLEPALRLVQDMVEDGLEPDDIIVNRLLDGCRHLSNGDLADQIFKDFIASGNIKPTPPTIATMVKIYGKCNRVEDAAQLVRTMKDRFGLTPSVVLYTCLMSACTRNRRIDLGMEAFHAMVKAGIEPDALAYTTLLKGCEQEKDWNTAVQIARVAVSRPRKAPFPMEEFFSVLNHMTQSDLPRSRQYADALRNVLRERCDVSGFDLPAKHTAPPPGVWKPQTQSPNQRQNHQQN